MKKRVLYHIKSLSSGGAQGQLLYTVLAAEREGDGVKTVIDRQAVQFKDMLQGSGVEVVVACPAPNSQAGDDSFTHDPDLQA